MTAFEAETAVALRSVETLRRRSPRSFVPPRSSIDVKPMIPKPVTITRLTEIIAKRVETTLQPVRPIAGLSFAWDARVFQATPNTVYLATLCPNDIAATLEQVAHYERIGAPRAAIVIVGNYRDLGYETYAALKRTGAVLKRVQSDLTDEVRSRVEQELTPVFRNIFDLAPPPRFGEREYRYKATTPPLTQEALDQLVARINDPNYRPADE